jgi:hypothetical protein
MFKHDSLKRGEYHNYTFRLPTHVPELAFSIAADVGVVCLYASNCSQRPLPRMCQWTLLVDAVKQRTGTLTVRTAEHHCVAGLYHVGVYCLADASFSLACSASQRGAAGALLSLESQGGGMSSRKANLNGASPRRPAKMLPPSAHPRATKKPFIDEGILEASLSARVSLPRPSVPPMPGDAARAAAPASARAAPTRARSSWVTPGEVHHDLLLGECVQRRHRTHD